MLADPTSSTADAPQRCTSEAWDEAAAADIAVHVSTFTRSRFLSMLVERLEAQTLASERFEVVIVDNGSDDDTWAQLRALVPGSRLRIAALRLPVNRGPAAARNAAVAVSRAPLLAFTDDDCLPEAGWLDALLQAAEDGDVIQGRTEPDAEATGAWDRTIRIVGASPLFETCNIAYRRAHFDAVGGFDETNAIAARPGARAFGEDVLLGAAAVAAGARHVYADGAVVRHRYLPATYGDHVREMRNLAGFPALAREAPPLGDALWLGVFLTPRTAAFDLGVVAVLAALVRRRPAYLLGAVPWIAQTLPMTLEHGGRNRLVRLAQLGVADAVGAASLLGGSLRHRRAVL